MGDVYRNYTNGTDEIQSFIDADGNPITVEIGETVSILVEKESARGVVSIPPVGKQKLTNIYRNPNTGRMEIEFHDVPEG